MAGLVVEKVVSGSIAEELGIEPGDRLIAINGNSVRDIIDYNFHSSEEEMTLEVEKGDGEIWEMELERDEEEPLGLIFPPPKPRQCGNDCVFCFVHQLPKGLRAPLYVKDEDYRLSFLYGNYVTLTNLSRVEMERIKEQRLSPLYISVHAVDPALREELLGRRGIPPVMEQLAELAAARITMHTQVVLCPGVNDGAHLEKTVADLASLYPAVASIAVVPVGVTAYREGLPDLSPVTSEYAARFIGSWEARAKELAERLGEPFLFIADEFYLKGGVPFPPLESYGDFPQIENGVGMIPLFREEAEQTLAEAACLPHFKGIVVTGESPFRDISAFVAALSRQTGVQLETLAARNLLFGGGVTVTGLLGGADILSALQGADTGDVVFIPDVALKECDGIFLDGLSPEELSQKLGKPVLVVDSSPSGLYRGMLEFGGRKIS